MTKGLDRRTIRLRGYDYTQAGAYFVTICTHHRECIFGRIVDGEMWLSPLGDIVAACWQAIPEHFPDVSLDSWVVMPNHLHGIAFIHRNGVGTRHAVSLQSSQGEAFSSPVPRSLPTIIRSYKSAAARRINQMQKTPGKRVWQSRFYEHVIRNDVGLERIREYIEYNPARWAEDKDNPANWDTL